MAIRTALLNGNNITRDSDFSKYIETVSEPGVIEGLEVSASSVATGKARVPCERTNGETIYALVYITSEVSISGNGDVYIKVNQTYIDDGELANEDGTGIATIEVGTMPSKNALKLAIIDGSTITDERHMIVKVGDLDTYIKSLQERMTQAEQDIEDIQEKGAVSHLEDNGYVGEKYTLENDLFKQKTPEMASCTVDVNVGDLNANKQVHIQRIGSGTASNKLKIKVKKVGTPSKNLVVEVRRGVQVDVSDSEAYWYGGNLVCFGGIVPGDIGTDYAELEVAMNGDFGGLKGELLNVVVYQADNTVNSEDYYVIACDSTQYSEAFSCVSVNGETRVRKLLMPYCISNGFMDTNLVKNSNETLSGETTLISFDEQYDVGRTHHTFTLNFYGAGTITPNLTFGLDKDGSYKITLDGVQIKSYSASSGLTTTYTDTSEVSLGAHTYEIYVSWGGYSGANVKAGSIVEFNYTQSKKGDISYEPQEIKEPGELLKLPFFGLYDNKVLTNMPGIVSIPPSEKTTGFSTISYGSPSGQTGTSTHTVAMTGLYILTGRSESGNGNAPSYTITTEGGATKTGTIIGHQPVWLRKGDKLELTTTSYSVTSSTYYNRITASVIYGTPTQGIC